MSSFQELEDRITLLEKDLEMVTEALLEHIANLDDSRNLLIDSIVEGINARVSEESAVSSE